MGKKENKKWDKIPSEDVVERTIVALKNNGINTFYVEDEKEARELVFRMLPEGVEVMVMSSVTLDNLGISKKISEGRFESVRDKLKSMDKNIQGKEMRKMGAVSDYAIGSIQAVTEDGRITIASATGSQMPAYVYGAGHVIFVVGVQKIVKDLDGAVKRIYEYCLPLENERAKKAYGVNGSSVNKILIINREIKEGRISLIFVNRVLGF